MTVNFLEISSPHNAAAHASRRMRQRQQQETQNRSASTAPELNDLLTIQKANMNCSGAVRLLLVLTPTLAQTAVVRGLAPSLRTLVVQAGTSSSLKSVNALVVARVSISHANASLFKVGVTLGGFPFIMPREFRGPAYHSQATSNASLS